MLKQYPARSACRQTVRPVGLLFFILAAQCLMAQAATWGVSTNLQVEDLGTPVRFTGEQGRVVFRSLKTGELHLLSLYLPYVGIQGRDHPFQIHDLNLTKNQAVIVAGMVGRPAKCSSWVRRETPRSPPTPTVRLRSNSRCRETRPA